MATSRQKVHTLCLALMALEQLGAHRFERFGTAGNAARIKPLSLAAMAGRYANGTLEPAVS